ncbi:hypothetical protein DPMN_062318 [Dreissena polymorpha]|uniref:Uncharacterized protein n=1 Tax=Dreissena polymorpha TaxID=45954 RepID=A0A9D4HK38_DREPO|nr:hypothetical protein DPMN_062318 [Dreissena polymorpha]
MKLKLTSKCTTKNPRVRFDSEKLRYLVIEEVFRTQIGGKFAALNILDHNIDKGCYTAVGRIIAWERKGRTSHG